MSDDIPFHPLANIFPRMTNEEFEALVQDIKLNGLRQPIVLFEKKILDGRHRCEACRSAGRELTDKNFTDLPVGTDPLKFVISQNVHRRHLNESQRAIIAAGVAKLKHGANQHRKEDGLNDLSTKEAATMLKVSEKSVKRARNVLDQAAPELVNKVRTGELRVGKLTKDILKKPHAEQVAAVNKKPNPKSVTADEAYDDAQDKLIQKLKALAPDNADAAATKTIRELKETVSLMKTAAKNAAAKAA